MASSVASKGCGFCGKETEIIGACHACSATCGQGSQDHQQQDELVSGLHTREFCSRFLKNGNACNNEDSSMSDLGVLENLTISHDTRRPADIAANHSASSKESCLDKQKKPYSLKQANKVCDSNSCSAVNEIVKTVSPKRIKKRSSENNGKKVVVVEGSSESVITGESKSLDTALLTACQPGNEAQAALLRRNKLIANYVVTSINRDGICVVDNFLGNSIGDKILRKVQALHKAGVFTDGQLVAHSEHSQNIRGDKITWLDGTEKDCAIIAYLISRIDVLMVLCKGQLQGYEINERTKAMIACYPGNGAKYVRHVDNPNKDGRCVTCIYYLNKDWNAERDGGILQMYPTNQQQVADIIPKFDRLLLFWSDNRNPHEVQAAASIRYAITVWYFDANERAEAAKRCGSSVPENDPKKHSMKLSPAPGEY